LDPPNYAPSNPAAYSKGKNERNILTHNSHTAQYSECVLDTEGVPDKINHTGHKYTYQLYNFGSKG